MVENPGGPFQKHKNEQEENEIAMALDNDTSDSEDESYPESQEFASIDNQLDLLNSVLDNLEQKNDVILAELETLLNENKEIRKQLQECRVNNEHFDPNSQQSSN